MRFAINLPAGIAPWAVGAAGIDPSDLIDLEIDVVLGKATVPRTLACTCHRGEAPCRASLTVLGFGQKERIDRRRGRAGQIVIKRGQPPQFPTRLEIEIADATIGRTVRKFLQRYSFENDGEGRSWREHCELHRKIHHVLQRDKLSYDRIESGEQTLTRRAIEGLIDLCRRTEPHRRQDIHFLLTKENIPKQDRPFVAAWFIREFESCWKANDQLGMCLWDLAVPAIADDLIRLILDPRYGDERWPLALALAQTRNPRAAEVIATLLGQGLNTRGALEALAKVPARDHLPTIREYLRDPDPDVRREARKTLKKLGAPIDRPPPPKHLIKGRRSLPGGLDEWSTNLDIDDLVPTLRQISARIERGFGPAEIAEIAAVVEDMAVDQTRVFRFPIRTQGKPADLWVVLFLDDIDSPDLAIHAAPALIAQLDNSLAVRD